MEQECRTCSKKNTCSLYYKPNCSSYVKSKCYNCSHFSDSAKDWISHGCENRFPAGCNRVN